MKLPDASGCIKLRSLKSILGSAGLISPAQEGNPVPWGIAIGAVAGIAGSALQAGAASDAASAQAGAAENAQQISQNEFNTITAQNAPYMQSGYGALSALDWGLGINPQTSSGTLPGQYAPTQSVPGGISAPNLYAFPGQSPIAGMAQYQPGAAYSGGMGSLGGSGIPISASASGVVPPQTGGLGFGSLTKPFDMSDWQKLSPAYNFQLQQGQQGVLNSDAPGQGALSGATIKDFINYNQGQANTSFNNAFNQYQTQQGNIFNRLSGIAQLGQSSANNTGQQGTALAGQAAQSATNIGTAQAGGIVGSANAIAGGLSSAVPWLMSANYGGGGSSSYGSGGSGGGIDLSNSGIIGNYGTYTGGPG